MKPVLVDTGPLVALIDRGDHDHDRCVAAVRGVRGALVTTWPVITEAVYLLTDVMKGQDALLGKIETGDLGIADLDADDTPLIRALMQKYGDLPMDFADASLVAVAERDGLENVFTLDRDFAVYKRAGRHSFHILPDSPGR